MTKMTEWNPTLKNQHVLVSDLKINYLLTYILKNHECWFIILIQTIDLVLTLLSLSPLFFFCKTMQVSGSTRKPKPGSMLWSTAKTRTPPWFKSPTRQCRTQWTLSWKITHTGCSTGRGSAWSGPSLAKMCPGCWFQGQKLNSLNGIVPFLLTASTTTVGRSSGLKSQNSSGWMRTATTSYLSSAKVSCCFVSGPIWHEIVI